MRGRIVDKIRLQHIFDAINEIEFYIGEAEFEKFNNDSMMKFACIKQIEIIGEASNHISEPTKLKFSLINWSQIVGLRNVLVQEYFGIDSELVWQIIKSDLPEFKVNIKKILNSIE